MFKNYIDSEKELLLKDLAEMIKIPSKLEGYDNPEYPFGKNIDNALNAFLKIGEKLGFKTKNIEAPKLKARLLMQFILKQTRQYIIVYDEKNLTLKQEKSYFEKVEKIIQGIPLQHITHQQEFMKMNFYVSKDVLIPRPDTEVLVEEVIKIAKKINAKKILDLCTGSGAIGDSRKKCEK